MTAVKAFSWDLAVIDYPQSYRHLARGVDFFSQIMIATATSNSDVR